mmetsp:Transcript_3960/g.11250  ORF Transcript_3960/g.11250 Transcript_3960/m.11250 type:complete len:291 (+) Transcript_3960:1734-2606(+)
MSENAEASNVGAGRGAVLNHQPTTVAIEPPHGADGGVHHILSPIVVRHLLLQTFLPQPIVLMLPLLDIDSNLRPERFGQNDDMSQLGSIGGNILTLGHDGGGNAPNNWPGIQNGLPACDGRLGLIARIAEPPDHLLGANGPLIFRHIPAGRKQHQDKVAVFHPLRIQVRQHVGGPDPSLQVGRVHEREEEVSGADAVVSLPRFADAGIQRDPTIGRAEVGPIAQAEVCKHLLQLVLGDLAGSSLEGRPIRQGPACRKADRRGVEAARFLPAGGEYFAFVWHGDSALLALG